MHLFEEVVVLCDVLHFEFLFGLLVFYSSLYSLQRAAESTACP